MMTNGTSSLVASPMARRRRFALAVCLVLAAYGGVQLLVVVRLLALGAAWVLDEGRRLREQQELTV